MAPLVGGKGSGFGPVGTLRNFMSVLREISFDDVRDEAETLPRLLILAPSIGTARQLGAALVGPEGELAVTAREVQAPLPELSPFDVAVVLDPDRSGVTTRLRERASATGVSLPVVRFEGGPLNDAGVVERCRVAVVSGAPDRAPALGRAFPLFRRAAAKAVIDETSRANAQFALVSNIPAVIPIVGSLAAAGADFLVLTKNQLMMIFKLAAIHGRDLHDQLGIFQEMVPVVGAGFLWRTVAREAASFLPLAAGTLPKVAIAYAGTLAAGRGADFYYRTTRRPTGDQTRLWYQQAVEAVRKLPLPIELPLPGGSAAEGARGDDQGAVEIEPLDGPGQGRLHALPPVPPEEVPTEGDGEVPTPEGRGTT